MFAGIGPLLADWLSQESATSLIMFVTAVMLFATAFKRLRADERFRSAFVAPLTLAFIQALVFIGVIGTFYVLLDSSYKAFKPLATSLAQGEEFQKELEASRKRWGARVYQYDMVVTQTTSHVEVVEVPGTDDKPLYINQTVIEPVEQESVTRFNGSVNIHIVDRRLSTYTLNAKYEYDVVNQSDQETNVTFRFPVGKDHIFRSLSITVDGKDLGSQNCIQDGMLSWEQVMQPGQKLMVVISFETQGTESYVFTIPDKKSIPDFSLMVDVDSRDMYAYAQPESTAIALHSEPTANGYHTSWTIKNSIIAPNLGIVFGTGVQPNINQKKMIRIFEYMPRGLMLLVIVVVFTMTICSVPVNLWKLALLAAMFSANFLLLMGLDLVQIAHPVMLVIFIRPTLVILSTIYQKLPRLPLRLILSAAAVFLLGYPYAGLLAEGSTRTAFDSLMQALIILYVFVLAFYVRVRGDNVVGEE